MAFEIDLTPLWVATTGTAFMALVLLFAEREL